MPNCQADDKPAVVQWQRKNAADPNSTDAVYSCADHAISLELASLLHETTCAAPGAACNCTPVALPTSPAEPEQPPVDLPSGW